MSYVEILSAFWCFIKEIMKTKSKDKKNKKEVTVTFLLSVLLITSLLFNLFLFVRVFDITRHYMEIHAVDSKTIKLLTVSKQQPVVKVPSVAAVNVTEPKKPIQKPKQDKSKLVENRVNNLKDRFDKIKNKED